MAWSDVIAKIKFYGVDDSPPLVNGIPAAGYGTAFSASEKSDILAARASLADVARRFDFTWFLQAMRIRGHIDFRRPSGCVDRGAKVYVRVPFD